jgi:hypothetical protein
MNRRLFLKSTSTAVAAVGEAAELREPATTQATEDPLTFRRPQVIHSTDPRSNRPVARIQHTLAF